MRRWYAAPKGKHHRYKACRPVGKVPRSRLLPLHLAQFIWRRWMKKIMPPKRTFRDYRSGLIEWRRYQELRGPQEIAFKIEYSEEGE